MRQPQPSHCLYCAIAKNPCAIIATQRQRLARKTGRLVVYVPPVLCVCLFDSGRPEHSENHHPLHKSPICRAHWSGMLTTGYVLMIGKWLHTVVLHCPVLLSHQFSRSKNRQCSTQRTKNVRIWRMVCMAQFHCLTCIWLPKTYPIAMQLTSVYVRLVYLIWSVCVHITFPVSPLIMLVMHEIISSISDVSSCWLYPIFKLATLHHHSYWDQGCLEVNAEVYIRTWLMLSTHLAAAKI